MKLTRIVVLCLALLLAWAGPSGAQIPCDSINVSPVDSVVIVETIGLPGQTVWVPLYVGNYMGVGAISVHLEYDSNLIKPLIWYTDMTIDTSYYVENCRDTVIGDDTLLVCDTLQDPTIDTVTISNYYYNLLPRFDSTYHYPQVVEEVDFPASGSRKRLKFLGLLKAPMDFEAAIDSGEGEIVQIGFEIDSLAPMDTTTTISFYEAPIYSDSVPFPQIG